MEKGCKRNRIISVSKHVRLYTGRVMGFAFSQNFAIICEKRQNFRKKINANVSEEKNAEGKLLGF